MLDSDAAGDDGRPLGARPGDAPPPSKKKAKIPPLDAKRVAEIRKKFEGRDDLW